MSLRLDALFVLTIVLFLFPAYATSSCLISLIRMNSQSLNLAIGDEVKIKLPDGSFNNAIFAGTSVRWADAREYFFIEKGSGIIFSIEGGYLENAGELKAEAHPTVLCQSGGTCAVHSTFKGLLFLNRLGEIRNPELSRALKNDPESVLNWLMDTGINGEVHEVLFNMLTPNEQKKLPDQTTIRISALQALMVVAKREGRPSQIRRHLESGFPVILDIPVRDGREQTLRYLREGGFATMQVSRLKPDDGAQPEDFLGKHSVLAVGFIPYGPFKGKVLVLDSNDGNAHLWDYSDIEKVRELKGTLLGPTDRMSEQDLRGKVRDYWRDYHTGRIMISTAGFATVLAGGIYLWNQNTQSDEEKKARQLEEKKKTSEEDSK